MGKLIAQIIEKILQIQRQLETLLYILSSWNIYVLLF